MDEYLHPSEILKFNLITHALIPMRFNGTAFEVGKRMINNILRLHWILSFIYVIISI